MKAKPDTRRKQPRVKAPKELLVGWESTSGQRAVSRAETIGLGGLFLFTAEPPANGSMIELLFDLTGGEVRARAAVRRSIPGKGMGIQFVQMGPEDRGRLVRYLAKFEIAEPAADPKPSQISATKAITPSLAPETNESPFEVEIAQLLMVAKKGTYYQLLGVTPESSSEQIKENFYARVRRFQLDRHMEQKELLGPLLDLTALFIEAYKTLKDEVMRSAYDQRLAASGASHSHHDTTKSEQTIEEYISRAKECLVARNFVGAIPYLRKCVELAPGQAKFHAALARSLATLPQYRDEAIDHFQKAIELDPWDATPYLQCADLYQEMQLPLLADNLYSELLKFNLKPAKGRESQHS